MNRAGETPLFKAASNNMHYPFLIAEGWNQKVEQGVLRKEPFDFFVEDKKQGKTMLHYLCQKNARGTMNIVLNQAPYQSMLVDDRLKLPLQYKSKAYLITWKLLFSMFKFIYLLELMKPYDNMDICYRGLHKEEHAKRQQMIKQALSQTQPIYFFPNSNQNGTNPNPAFAPGQELSKEMKQAVIMQEHQYKTSRPDEYLDVKNRLQQMNMLKTLRFKIALLESYVTNLYDPKANKGQRLDIRFADNLRCRKIMLAIREIGTYFSLLTQLAYKNSSKYNYILDILDSLFKETFMRDVNKFCTFLLQNFCAHYESLLGQVHDVLLLNKHFLGTELQRDHLFSLFQSKEYYPEELVSPKGLGWNMCVLDVADPVHARRTI